MKSCPECGCENMDEALFCRNCGVDLSNVQIKGEIRPVDDMKVIVNDGDKNSIISKLFYKTDKYSGELRIAKVKTVSIIVFIFFFLFGIFNGSYSPFIVFVSAIIFGLVFAVPTYIIGFVVGFIIDKLSN